MKTTIITSHTSSQRDSWWYLEQDSDRQLYVRHENQDDSSANWRKPLQEVLATDSGSIRKELQSLIDRMFEDRDV